MKTQMKVRGMALLTGGILAVSSLGATSAEARSSRHSSTSSKDLKTGAIVLGAIGVILAAKGKTIPAVIAGAGAYYAYSESQKAHDRGYHQRRDDRYGSTYNDRDRNHRYSQSDQRRNDDKSYDTDYNSSYDNRNNDHRRNDQNYNDARDIDQSYRNKSSNEDGVYNDDSNYDNNRYNNRSDDNVYPDALRANSSEDANASSVKNERDSDNRSAENAGENENDVSLD